MRYLFRSHGRFAYVCITVTAVCLAAAAVRAGVTIGPQIRIDVGGGMAAADETSIVTSALNENVIIGAWNDFRVDVGVGYALSLDGGQTWVDGILPVPPEHDEVLQADPMTAVDPLTGDLFVGGLAYNGNRNGIFVLRLRNGQTQFDPPVPITILTGIFDDKAYIAAGPDPDNPNQTNIYCVWNDLTTNNGLGFSRSTDGGQTWSPRTRVGNFRAIGAIPAVGPNGELYVAYWSLSNPRNIEIVRSFDAGDTWDGPIVVHVREVEFPLQDGPDFPGRFRVPPLPSIAVNPIDGTVSVVYFDRNGQFSNGWNIDTFIAESTNQGASFTEIGPIHGDASPPGDQFFGWIDYDTSGNLHAVWYDSRNVVQNDNTINGMFDAYYGFRPAGTQAWQEFRLTPESFNSADSFGPFAAIDPPNPTWGHVGGSREREQRGGGQFMGDYLGLRAGATKVWPIYMSTQNGDSDIFTHEITIEGGALPGDFDGDGDVDLADFAFFSACFTGSGNPCSGDCCRADLDGDGDVDIADFSIFTDNFTGSR